LKQIQTREQLEHEIWKILEEEIYFQEYDEWDTGLEYGDAIRRICDLIADLNSNCYHEHIE